MSLSTRHLAVLTFPLVAALALTACQSDAGATPAAAGTSGGGAAKLFSRLPQQIQDAKTIQVGSSIDYPPFEYYDKDGKTQLGFETELAKLLEGKLGVTFTWNNASFDTLFSALRAGRYDLVYGATNDTAEREQAFDFVYYLKSSQGFVVAKGNPAGIKTEDDLCGKTIAAVRGGVQAQYLDAKAAECQSSGKGTLTPLLFAGNAEEQLALKQGKAQAMLENYPTAAAFAQESKGELEVLDLQVSQRYYGMVLPKDNSALRDTLVAAWQQIIDDGSYGKVLKKWHLESIGITKAGINAVATKAE